jgi:hypothetical protein
MRDKAYGIARGWPIACGQVPIDPDALPSNNLIATLGDSRTQQGTVGTVGNEAGTARDPTQRMGGYQLNLEAASRGRIQSPPIANFGLAGDTTGPFGANPGVSTRVSNIIATGADACVLLSSINDRGSPDQTAAWSISYLDQIITQLTAARIRVFLIAELMRGSVTYPSQALSEPQLQYQKDVHAWCLAQSNRSLVTVIDAWPVMCANNNIVSWVDNLTTDGLHQNQHGAKVLGYDVMWPIIRSYYTSFPDVVIDATTPTYNATTAPDGNLLLNGMFTGTGGTIGSGAVGTLATNWTNVVAAGTSMTLTAGATAVGSDGVSHDDWQRIQVTGTPTAASPALSLTTTVPLGRIAALDRLTGNYEFVLATATGLSSLRSRFRLTFQSGPAAQASVGGDNSGYVAGLLDYAPYSGVLRLPEFTIDNGTPSTSQTYGLICGMVQNVPVNIDLFIRAASLRKVIN